MRNRDLIRPMNRQHGRSRASWKRFSACLCVSLLLSSVFASAGGPEPPPSDIATARIVGTEGLRLAEAGDCAAAVEKLARAEALYHAPTTLGRLGECQVRLGHIVAGTENLQRVVREQLAPTASPAFQVAKDRAKQVLADALPRIAMLRLSVHVPDSRTWSVRFDGRPASRASLGVERPTDPGLHTIEVEAPGCERVEKTVTLDEGGEASVSIAMVCSDLLTPSVVAPPPPVNRPGTIEPRDDTIAFVALGVGAAGVATGSIFGLMALGNKSALADTCDARRTCPTSSQSELEALDRNALLSSIGFGVGLAGAALGTTLLLWPAGESSADKGTSATLRGRGARAWIGPGSAGLAGAF